MALLALVGCIDFPAAPRCTPGGCEAGFVCDPATTLCVPGGLGQDFGFLEPDQGVGGDDAAPRDAAPDDAAPRDATPDVAVVDARPSDAAEPDAQADALPDAQPDAQPDAAGPATCEVVEEEPVALDGGNVSELALASNGERVLVAWSLESLVPNRRQLRVRVGAVELPLPAEAVDFTGTHLHAAGTTNRFALTWTVNQRLVAVRVLQGALDGLQPPTDIERNDLVRHPQIIAVPEGWVVVWQEAGPEGVRFVRANLRANGTAVGEPVVLNPASPLDNPATVRPHTLVLQGASLYVLWDPGAPAGQPGPPSMFFARLAAAFDNPAAVVLAAPPGQAPTAAVYQDRVYVLWSGMDEAFLVVDAEQGGAGPIGQVQALMGRRAPVAVNDGGRVGVLACAIQVAGSCEEIRYLRIEPPEDVPPEWSHAGQRITNLRLVAHNEGVAAAWIEQREQRARAVYQTRLLTPACRQPGPP